jgi:hypothetical protein
MCKEMEEMRGVEVRLNVARDGISSERLQEMGDQVIKGETRARQ